MIESNADIHISVPPRRVWEVLIDFSSYPEWNPYVAVRGAAALGSKVQWAYSSQPVKRVWTSATITYFDVPNAITWSFRMGWLFRLEESFRVHPTSEGTKVTHSIRCHGMIAQLGKRSLIKTFAGVISTSNIGLRRYVESAGSIAQKPPSASINRHAKTKKRRTRSHSKRR